MKITLYYFKIPFWRAEVSRLALYIGDIPFKDYRIEGADRDKFKETGILPNNQFAPFKQLPVLDVDGKIWEYINDSDLKGEKGVECEAGHEE